MADLKGVLVVGELAEHGLSSLTKELLGGARDVLDVAEGEVSLLLIGKGASSSAEEGIAFGADRVYIADDETADEFPLDFLTDVVSALCRQIGVSLCLMGQTDAGREAAPRAAARVGGNLCMDCVDVRSKADEGVFVQVRPAFGGKAMAEIASQRGAVQFDTVRQKALSGRVRRSDRTGRIVDWKAAPRRDALRTRLVERKREEQAEIGLESARVIVAGGGGIGGSEGFALIRELSRLLKAAVGASRVPVDEGWVEHSIEIGQTGKIVSPDVYVAVGISGATQHVTGIQGSKCIIAINKDPDANIFKVADIGVVADYKALLPRLIEKLKVVA